MTDNTHTADIVEALREDGDTFDLQDGRTLVLRIRPDEDMTVLDDAGEGSWFGRIEWDTPRRENAYGWRLRPDGMNGRAEVLHRDRDDRLWWQVPADVEIGSDLHASMRQTIRDLLEYGYQGYVVELLAAGGDYYGRRPVLNAASLWGVEPFADKAYVAEIVRDLVGEVLDQ